MNSLAKQVRTELKLNKTDAGVLLFNYEPNYACANWRRWENGERKMSLSTVKYFELILELIQINGIDSSIKIIKLK